MDAAFAPSPADVDAAGTAVADGFLTAGAFAALLAVFFTGVFVPALDAGLPLDTALGVDAVFRAAAPADALDFGDVFFADVVLAAPEVVDRLAFLPVLLLAMLLSSGKRRQSQRRALDNTSRMQAR